jgi:hypothetical protein
MQLAFLGSVRGFLRAAVPFTKGKRFFCIPEERQVIFE